MERASDRGKSCVLHLEEKTSCIVGPGLIVSSDAISTPVLWKAIDADYSGASATVGLRLRREVAEIGWDHDETGGKVSAQFIEVHQFFGMVVVRIAKNQAISV